MTSTTVIVLVAAALALLILVKVVKGLIRLALTAGIVLLVIWYVSKYFPSGQ